MTVGEADVAYQVLGSGLPDVLFCYGLGSQVDLIWDIDSFADFWHRVATFSRCIIFDRRGTGASDAVPRNIVPTWEEWAEDVGAVLDAAGSKEARLSR